MPHGKARVRGGAEHWDVHWPPVLGGAMGDLANHEGRNDRAETPLDESGYAGDERDHASGRRGPFGPARNRADDPLNRWARSQCLARHQDQAHLQRKRE